MGKKSSKKSARNEYQLGEMAAIHTLIGALVAAQPPAKFYKAAMQEHEETVGVLLKLGASTDIVASYLEQMSSFGAIVQKVLADYEAQLQFVEEDDTKESKRSKMKKRPM